jgi:hypothetical protein
VQETSLVADILQTPLALRFIAREGTALMEPRGFVVGKKDLMRALGLDWTGLGGGMNEGSRVWDGGEKINKSDPIIIIIMYATPSTPCHHDT